MFDPEQSIVNWRIEMRKRDIGNERIEELERHLRDSLSQVITNGRPPEEAWNEAIADFGMPEAVAAEFDKLDEYCRPNRFMVGIIFIGLACLSLYSVLASRIIEFNETVTLSEAIHKVLDFATYEMIVEQVNSLTIGASLLVILYLLAGSRINRSRLCWIAFLFPFFFAEHGILDFLLKEVSLSFVATPLVLPGIFWEHDGEYYDDIFFIVKTGLWYWTWLILLVKEARLKRKLRHLIPKTKRAIAAFREPLT